MKSVTAAVLAFATLGATVAQAAPINAGFESSDLTGWTSVLAGGSATVVTSNSTSYIGPATYLPQEGGYFLAIQSGFANQWQTVSQSMALAPGGTLSGLAAFDWGDYLPYEDGVRVRILDGNGGEVAVPFYFDGSDAPGPNKLGWGSPDSGYNGPWTAWSWTATSAGTYTVEYAARNTLDSGGPEQTFGYFDALQATSVPEPGSIALLGVALLGLGAVRRRVGSPA